MGIANGAALPSARSEKESGAMIPGAVGEVSVTSVTKLLAALPAVSPFVT
jgi:hypothetical protein